MLAAYLVKIISQEEASLARIISLEEASLVGINQVAVPQVRVFNLLVLVLVVNFDYLEVPVLFS